MATWKKVIVSGSDISQLNNDLNFAQEGVAGQNLSGSFSGSFVGDGSALTGVVGTISNALTDGNGISDFSYDGSSSGVTVAVETSGSTLNVTTAGVAVSALGITTAELAADAVTNAKLADDAVDTENIADDAITAALIDDGAVGTAALADDAVTSAKLDALAVDTAAIDTAAVTTTKIADDAVTNAKIASDAVNGDSIANGSISVAMMSGSAVVTSGEGIGSNDTDNALPTAAAVKAYADSVVGAADLDFAGDSGTGNVDLDSQSLTVAGGSGLTSAASGQTVTLNISASGVTNAMLEGSIANAKLANSAITIAGTSTSLGGSIGGDDIISDVSAGQVTNAQLANSSIDIAGTDISLGGTVTGDDIISDVSAGQVTNAQLANSAITIGSESIALGGSITTFSGSFLGDGSGLTNVPASGINLADLTDGNGIADFTYDGGTAASIAVQADGSTLSVGASGVKVADAGVTETQLNASVAGTGLSGGAGTALSVDYGSSAGTAAEGDSTVTFTGTANEVTVSDTSAQAIGGNVSVTIGLPDDVTVTQDLTVGRNLVVQGTASFQHTEDLAIADRFILLASGSTSTGDGGIVVQQTNQDVGEVFAFDAATERWAIADAFNASQNVFTPDAFMANVSTGNASSNTAINALVDDRYESKGNLFVGDDEGIWIYS